MIISASRRTDIPAFYAEWLENRISAGSCTVANPFNPNQVATVDLRPEAVDAIVFWTRHPRPIFPLLHRLAGDYVCYFQYTITGYGRPLEARTPPLEVAVTTFRQLAERLPAGAVIWRYDPIVVGPAFTAEYHLERFAEIASALEGATRRVVISLLHVYRKTRRRLGAIYRWGEEIAEQPAATTGVAEMLAAMVAIASRHGIVVEACAQPVDYRELGIAPTSCIDRRLLEELSDKRWPPARDSGQRSECRCLPSKDIGAVDSCGFGCAYCYATVNDQRARERRRQHDPAAPALAPTRARPARGGVGSP